MITEQLNKLNDTAKAFLNDKNFDAMELEEVMDDVFGADQTGIEVIEWKGYWKELELYEEKLTEDLFTAGTAPKVSLNYLFSVRNIQTSSCLQTPASGRSDNGSQELASDPAQVVMSALTPIIPINYIYGGFCILSIIFPI